MARERMVTRTILETEVDVICMDVNTVETQIKNVHAHRVAEKQWLYFKAT